MTMSSRHTIYWLASGFCNVDPRFPSLKCARISNLVPDAEQINWTASLMNRESGTLDRIEREPSLAGTDQEHN
jgi:hypothetical protein